MSAPRHARTASVLAAAALACALVLLPAAAASAHVRVVPESTAAGGWTVLTFRVPNESPTAATTRVTVDLPTATPLTSVSTRPLPGWTATVEEGDLPEPVEVGGATLTRAPVRVVWTADGEGIADGEFEEFALSVGPLPDAGTRLVLPAHQEYADGEVVDWDEVADDAAEPEHPAPELTTTAAGEDHGHDDTAGVAPRTAPDRSADVPARVLGGLGLAAGAAGLVVALRSRRRGSDGAR